MLVWPPVSAHIGVGACAGGRTGGAGAARWRDVGGIGHQRELVEETLDRLGDRREPRLGSPFRRPHLRVRLRRHQFVVVVVVVVVVFVVVFFVFVFSLLLKTKSVANFLIIAFHFGSSAAGPQLLFDVAFFLLPLDRFIRSKDEDGEVGWPASCAYGLYECMIFLLCRGLTPLERLNLLLSFAVALSFASYLSRPSLPAVTYFFPPGPVPPPHAGILLVDQWLGSKETSKRRRERPVQIALKPAVPPVGEKEREKQRKSKRKILEPLSCPSWRSVALEGSVVVLLRRPAGTRSQLEGA